MYLNEEYAEIGHRLIETLPEFDDIKEAEVSIAYLSSDKEKKTAHKKVLGECRKVDTNYTWCCPFDFLIGIYEQNIAGFDDKQIETLIRHELHHIGVEMTNTGYGFYIVPHDIEEFYEILFDCGYDWSDVNG